ncbi:hypothetical protein FM106_22420 [Brachybacterium faecium]|nr:hypothetical protein FM106_22420 [Brachybacterium faecium]
MYKSATTYSNINKREYFLYFSYKCYLIYIIPFFQEIV